MTIITYEDSRCHAVLGGSLGLDRSSIRVIHIGYESIDYWTSWNDCSVIPWMKLYWYWLSLSCVSSKYCMLQIFMFSFYYSAIFSIYYGQDFTLVYLLGMPGNTPANACRKSLALLCSSLPLCCVLVPGIHGQSKVTIHSPCRIVNACRWVRRTLNSSAVTVRYIGLWT